jgi:Na+-driven multidrug efflux pump
MAISLVMLALEAGLAAVLILVMRREGFPVAWQATGPAIALCLALAFASIAKSWLLRRQLHEPVGGWRSMTALQSPSRSDRSPTGSSPRSSASPWHWAFRGAR